MAEKSSAKVANPKTVVPAASTPTRLAKLTRDRSATSVFAPLHARNI